MVTSKGAGRHMLLALGHLELWHAELPRWCSQPSMCRVFDGLCCCLCCFADSVPLQCPNEVSVAGGVAHTHSFACKMVQFSCVDILQLYQTGLGTEVLPCANARLIRLMLLSAWVIKANAGAASALSPA